MNPSGARGEGELRQPHVYIDKIAGPISPGGWCQFFAARENAR
jgi:hypothetical protein